MKILITGGCGFLGSNLAKHFSIKNKVFIVDNLSRAGSSENFLWIKNLNQKIEFHSGDVRIKGDIDRAMQITKPDVVIHLAGQVAMTTSLENPYGDFLTNALGTINVLEAIKNLNPSCKFIYSSTNKVYGDLEQFTYNEDDTRFSCVQYPIGFNEQIGLDFKSPYGCSKGAADQYTLDYGAMFGLNTVVLRHSSMYGGRQFSTADQGWIGWFIKQFEDAKKNNAKKVQLFISGNGKQVRDILHAVDMCNLYEKIINSNAIGAFNVGGGYERSISLIELFRNLSNFYGIDFEIVSSKQRLSDQKVFISDNSKIINSTSWNPVVNINEGLEDAINWAKII